MKNWFWISIVVLINYQSTGHAGTVIAAPLYPDTVTKKNQNTTSDNHHLKEEEKNQTDILNKDENFLPKIIEALKKTQKYYQDLKIKYPVWPQWTCSKSSFSKGDKDKSIEVIRQQLMALNYLSSTSDLSSDEMDENLEKAILVFQKAHSLNVDGKIGSKTCKALNLTPEKRIQLISKTIDELKKIKKNFTGKYILINVPTYHLLTMHNDFIEGGQSIIVGSPSRKTPLITTHIMSIILNPSWSVPHSIFIKDKLNKVIQDPEYLDRAGFEIYDTSGQKYLSSEIDWQNISYQYFPYHIQQKPGDHNALGKIKFYMQNSQAIYMHGTPQTHLFQKGSRAFSSGCIRLHSPLELAVWVMNDQQSTLENIQKKIESRKTIHLPLSAPIPVYIVYLPVWVNKNHEVEFGDDPYNYFK